MIESGALHKIRNAGSIVAISDGGTFLEIVLEDSVSIIIGKSDEGFDIRVHEHPMLEKKDDDLPVLTVSVTLWPGQDQKDWLKLLDAAVRRAQGVM